MIAVVNINITLTDMLAVWGAFIATLVLLWDIYKYKVSGAQVHISVRHNMNVLMPDLDPDSTFIAVIAKNNGDRPTTITNFGLKGYKVIIPGLFKKRIFQAIIGNPVPQPLPHLLAPGAVWNGFADQGQITAKHPEVNLVVMEIYLSHRKKPTTARVILKGHVR
jgi:hypothetical protein